MQDRELLECAAQVAGHKIYTARQAERDAAGSGSVGLWLASGHTCWNPLTDDGDALKLAVQLEIDIRVRSVPVKATASAPGGHWIEESGADKREAVRRAIVRAAAALVPHLKTPNV
jgi:hypothetical protein